MEIDDTKIKDKDKDPFKIHRELIYDWIKYRPDESIPKKLKFEGW